MPYFAAISNIFVGEVELPGVLILSEYDYLAHGICSIRMHPHIDFVTISISEPIKRNSSLESLLAAK
ncbi:MAG: hypothetical protein RL232_595 [Actinomycetota bacterium]